MNHPDELAEEQLASWLAACDDALAAGGQSSIDDLDASAELKPRLARDWNCVQLLRQFWPGLNGNQGTAGSESKTLPHRIGRFEIRRELGQGGYGIVFLAHDPQLGREVALKIPRANVLVTAELRHRFHHEARAAASLDHPSVAAVYEAGEVGPISYIASAFCPGITLDAWLKKRRRPVPFDMAALLTATLAKAVQHAHSRGVLHRDLKPANIMLHEAPGDLDRNARQHETCSPTGTRRGDLGFSVKVMDFGLAKILDEAEAQAGQTRTGAVLGTPNYMSPEQAAGRTKDVTIASDVYSLGAILYQVLCGRPPLAGATTLDTLRRVESEEPAPPSRLRSGLPRDLNTVCLKCLRKEPSQRYPSAQALSDDLERFLAGEPLAARPMRRGERLWRWCRRKPMVASLTVAVSLLLILVTAGSILMGQHDRVLRGVAEQSKTRADRNARQSHERLVRQYVGHGMRLVDQGDLLMSLPWFAEALRIDDADPRRRRLHRIRLAATIRQCPKLSQVWYRESRATHLALSPDGRHVALGHEDGTVALGDVETGAQVARRLPGRVTACAFSNDGQMLVVATSEGTAQLRQVPSLKLIKEFAHETGIGHAAFAPNDGQVLTMCDDRQVRVWAVATGNMAAVLPHDDAVVFCSFSPDGQHVLTGCADRRIRIWIATTGQLVGKPLEHPYGLNSAEFSADGGRIVACGGGFLGAGEARVWDLRADPPGPLSIPHPEGVLTARFHPDGRRLLTASWDGLARVWDLGQHKLEFPPLVHQAAVMQARFSADGTRIVTCSYDRTARIWDAETGRPTTPPLPHGSFVMNCLFSPDGQRLVTRAWDKVTRVWDLAVGDDALHLAHDAQVASASFSPDGRRVVTACRDGRARLWDTRDGTLLNPALEHKAALRMAAFSPDGGLVVTASEDHTAVIWHSASGQRACPPLEHAGIVRSAAFRGDGQRVVTASDDGSACAWNVSTGQRVGGPMKHDAAVRDASFSPDGRFIVTASYDRTARIWDGETGELVTTLNHECPVERASFHPDGRWVVTACWDGSLENRSGQVWDVATAQPVGRPLKHEDGVCHARFSPDGTRVVTASEDGTARVWDAATGEPRTTPMHCPHHGHILFAAFSSDGAWVVTASRLKAAGLWDAATGEALMPPLAHGKAVNQIEVSPNGDSFVTASDDGTARLFRVHPDDRPAAALVRLAHVLAANRVDDTGGIVPLQGAQVAADWPKLRSTCADLLARPPGALLAWHRTQADECERSRRWPSAVRHLDRLIAAEATGPLLGRRGFALACQSQWDYAALDFENAIALGLKSADTYYHCAVAQLAARQADRYQDTCAELLAQLGQTTDVNSANIAAWTCVLAPNAATDPNLPVQMAERVVAGGSNPADVLNTLGAALYRAGQYEAAFERLNEGIRIRGNDGLVWDWLFLAMAEHRLGHSSEARRWLDLAIQDMDTQITAAASSLPPATADAAAPASPTLNWVQSVELQLLRQEAESLIGVRTIDCDPGRRQGDGD